MTRLCPPAPPAARPPSLRRPFRAPLGHPGSDLPRPGRVAGGLRARRLEAGGWEGLRFPTPSATLGSRPAGARLLGEHLCFLQSIPQGPRSLGVTGPPRAKETPIPAHAAPGPRERPRRSSSSLPPAGGVPRRSWARKRGQRAVSPPSSPCVRGAGFAQVCRAMPFPEPDSRAGREGRMIDRLN